MPSADSVDRVEKPNDLDPPSALRPAATAMPSTSVDLPDPFSPTRNVTPGPSVSHLRRSPSTTGRSKGYPVPAAFSSRAA